MAQRPTSNQTPRRRRRGFEPAAKLLSQRVQKAAEGRGFAVSRLLTHWPEIAGEALAAMTRPVRISHGRGALGATLTLLTTGATAPLVEMQLPQLRERVNACYGYNAIQKIVLTQTAASGFAEGRASFTHAAPQPAPPSPQSNARAQGIAARFDDPDLASAMARLTLNLCSQDKLKG